MSRSQQGSIYDTATANSGADQTAATAARTAEQGDISSYQNQLAKFAASNPYAQGGEFDTDTNKKLSAVADAGSGAITNQLQTQAARTGENATAANATAAEAARANLRDLSAGEAASTQARIGAKAGYDQSVVNAEAVPAELEQGIYSTSLGGGNTALGVGENAAQTPSFWDTLGSSFASQLGKTAAGGNLSLSKQL